MAQQENIKTEDTKSAAKSSMVSAPFISLPKGGGAVRGIGEKFAANPVIGTGSMSVPIAVTPGRSGFSPQLSLSYDSGSGNGPFGFGWSLSLPAITRKTDRGLPKYEDASDSDVFILSGAEDLVPEFEKDPDGHWVLQDGKPIIYEKTRTVDSVPYTIRRYRPRTEGLFARIERWTNTRTNETHWRSISRDNITTVYGRTTGSRLEDPEAPDGFPRVFSWLICESYDDKGNAIYYEYAPENSACIDLCQTNEGNRTDKNRSSNLYLKRIKYGNKAPVEQDSDLPRESGEDLAKRTDWLFELVFDYEEGHYHELPADLYAPRFVQARINPSQEWQRRQDPFSSYLSGFEVRTYRLCHRVLMFHHFPDELGVDDYLVRSTELKYKETPIASFITRVTQSGFKRQANGTYLKKSLPPLEFQYSEAVIQDKVQDVDEENLDNLPRGLDGALYQWADIDGEGLSGILTEQGDSWFYKRNISALPVMDENGEPRVAARFAPIEQLTVMPSFTNLSGGRLQLLDLAGDGQLDVVELDSPTPGFFERTKDEAWHTFKPFVSLPNISWQDSNLKFIDLTGDGHADIFITGDDAFTWYESLGEAGFASAEKVRQSLDEEKGPKLVFADGTQSVYLADFSGDGLTDLVRIRNGEVCYWPNLGYGRFGARVTMDNAPHFDAPDHFDQRRIRLADIDGSGVTDIIYLKGDGVYIYLNESGNRWADAEKLKSFPHIDNLSSVMAMDLLGNGTACLVWSSPLPAANGKQLRYIDLMGEQKPHLLVKTVNNLGAETHIHYSPSTKFYLADKKEGKPWVTRIPFPVHVVERVETYDRISRNRFITRYAYHHGYFDGIEREFRGFGMVEQWDTEEFAALEGDGLPDDAANFDEASHVPPVLTKTWFHTGAFIEGEKISRQFEREYYKEPDLAEEQVDDMLLPDTRLPGQVTLSDNTTQDRSLTLDETREACRALRGSILRLEVYARDGSSKSELPYSVSERSYEIKWLQPQESNRHAVFLVHPAETIDYHYERTLYPLDANDPNSAQLPDPRVSHQLNLEVDVLGNVLKAAAVGYGRRWPDPALRETADQDKQTKILLTYTENKFTNAIDGDDNYRTPVLFETLTYELTGLELNGNIRFSAPDLLTAGMSAAEIPYEETEDGTLQKRLIEHLRTLFRKDDLSAPLPLGQLEAMALPYDSYKLAFTPGLLREVFINSGKIGADDLAGVLGNDAAYVNDDNLKAADLFPASDPGGHWWIPAGRVFFSPDEGDTPAQERAEAGGHFFLPRRIQDPFGQSTIVQYDTYDLLPVKTVDPLDNVVMVETKDDQGNDIIAIDYRVLQPWLVVDPNGNRSAVAFDTLGMAVGTAIMGKYGENRGDTLLDFEPDLDDNTIPAHTSNPFTDPHGLLQRATTRMVYDLTRYLRTVGSENHQPNLVYTLTRETHEADLKDGQQTKIRHSFLYSDGFGREIQAKVQAEPGDAPLRQDNSADPDRPGPLIMDGDSPQTGPVEKRWVGTGRTVYNNKGKPVKKYEPFFSSTHLFEEEPEVAKTGVTPILFYDPVERVIVTLHPNHTYEKVVFDPWRQETWDVNDTVLQAEPQNDPEVGEFFQRLNADDYLPTWHESRKSGQKGPAEQEAAAKTAVHAGTPAIAYLDTLGRTFLTIADNGIDENGQEQKYETRVEPDIEGNTRSITDAHSNRVMEYLYSIQGPEREDDKEKSASRILYQNSMDAGRRWILNNVTGKPVKRWDDRNHEFTYTYDELQRPTHSQVKGGEGSTPLNNVFEKIVYGDWKGMTPAERAQSQSRNLIGKPIEHYDTAGKIDFTDYDFKGNLLNGSRRLSRDYKNVVNWNIANPDEALEDETFFTETRYDALNRVIRSITPDSSITEPTYNEANLLEKLDVTQKGITKPFVENIDYNEKGQRTAITYGNEVTTTYEYDKETFRLLHLETKKSNDKLLQDLYYTYDPVGNITGIEDKCIPGVFYNNFRIEPSSKYAYDPLYRLIAAEGREHIGQNNFGLEDNWNDNSFLKRYSPGDSMQWRFYTQKYRYDAVGNIEQMQHIANGGSWTRDYRYEDHNNRLKNTMVGNDTYTYPHHMRHGFMTGMPHLQVMEWNFKDELQAVAQQRRTDGGTSETTYYVYDAGGQRVRKVTENTADPGQTPAMKNERIYLGGVEVYREYTGSAGLERWTLHVMDDKSRIAMIETRNEVNDGTPAKLIRYQLSNHLGTACLETDGSTEARVISYEEYHPYGTTAYQAVDKDIKAASKRYRYTGMERDEESGLNYHGARYYAPWLARWTSSDPLQLRGGLNVYKYASGRPNVLKDDTGLQPDNPRAGRMNATATIAERYSENSRRLAEIQRRDEQAALDAAEAMIVALEEHEIDARYGTIREAPPLERNHLVALKMLAGSPFAGLVLGALRTFDVNMDLSLSLAAAGQVIESGLPGPRQTTANVLHWSEFQPFELPPHPQSNQTSPHATYIRPAGTRIITNLVLQHFDRRTQSLGGQLLQLTGELTPERLGTGTRTTRKAQAAARAASEETGLRLDAGHPLARSLGGLGDADVTFPQFMSTNRGSYNRFEQRLRRLVEHASGSDRIFFSIGLIWPEGAIMPSQVFYRVRINGRTVVRALFSNTENAVEFVPWGPSQ